MMHLSRFAEELVIWSSQEWSFVELGDAYTTGSSIMPQKKNPDMAELVRGKTGRVYGALVSLLTVMKGLPLAYNRDLQEDKEPLFDAADTLRACLDITGKMARSMKVDGSRFTAEAKADFLLATELADYLVRKNVPFRSAHAIVGDIVKECERRNCALKGLPLGEYRKRSKLFEKDLFKILDLRASIAAKRSEGSTAPKEVRTALRRWKVRLRSPKLKL
jgi:argininosuccinate lyase